ncbi:MAG: hypothetical protein NTZ73_02355 [Candidatus Diapherotrites archaeon]|nr:hypothetical protein [Candidatus Diapherotrites archaeon]
MKVLQQIALFLALTFLLSGAFAYSFEDLIWKGAVTIQLDKAEFQSGEPITGKITLLNSENYPLLGAKVVVQLAQGKYDYVAQFTTKDNVISEKNYGDIWILPNANKTINFSVDAQESGEYRIDIYSWALKSILIGNSAIFLAPASKEFKVSGGSAEAKASIDRENTKFNDTVGPVGFPVEPNGEIKGVVRVSNPSTVPKDSLKLHVSMCDWASAFCENPEETVVDVISIPAGGTVDVQVAMKAPAIPSAYEINLKLFNGDKTESVYKNRAIVAGGTAKFRKIFIDGLDVGKYSLNLLIAGSPDHFNYPAFEGYSIKAEIYDGEKLIEEKSAEGEKLGAGGEEFRYIILQSFNLESKKFTKICAKIEKGGTIYEQECFPAPIEEIQAAYDARHPRVVKVTWAYEESAETLSLTLEKESINARVRIFSSDETLFEEQINQPGIYKKSIYLRKGDLTMTVDDFDAKRQQMFTLDFSSKQSEGQAQPTECAGIICSAGEACRGNSYKSVQGLCCIGTCQPAIEPISFLSIFSIPFILWAAIIIIVIALAVLFTVLRSPKKISVKQAVKKKEVQHKKEKVKKK